MNRLLLMIILLFVFLSSCKHKTLPYDEAGSGKDYFPLAEGHFVEYAVDSLIYNTFNHAIDQVHLEFRDEVGEFFTDNLGRISYPINRFSRHDSTEAWTQFTTYYAVQTDLRLEVVDDNLRFVKMVYPVVDNTNWQGNVYIPVSGVDEIKWYLDWKYAYKNINQTFNNGLMDFPNSMVVEASIGADGTGLINDSTSTIDYSEFTAYKECYSKNIGMIYKQLTHWEYQPTEKFRNGFSVVLRATKHN